MRRCQPTMMSPSDLLRKTGLPVSTRQFRRYMKGGIIPGVIRGKKGHYRIVGPITPKRIETIRQRVRKFRSKPGRKKLKNLPPIHKNRSTSATRTRRWFSLPRIIMELKGWMRQCAPLEQWPDQKKRDVLREMIAPAAVALRLAEEMQIRIPAWNGTDVHLRELFQT